MCYGSVMQDIQMKAKPTNMEVQQCKQIIEVFNNQHMYVQSKQCQLNDPPTPKNKQETNPKMQLLSFFFLSSK